MEKLTFEVQHPDFSCTDAVEVSAEEAVRQVKEHDWSEELATFNGLLDKKKDCCPPGVFLRKPDDSYLQIYRNAADEFNLLLAVPVQKKILGLFPKRSWREIQKQATGLDELLALARDYATKPNDLLLQTL